MIKNNKCNVKNVFKPHQIIVFTKLIYTRIFLTLCVKYDICEVICPLSVHIDGLLVQNLPGPGHPLRAGG